MINNKKTFKDLKVGDTIYFGCLDSDHIMESRLVSIELLTDDNNCYTEQSEIRFTPIEFGNFTISRMVFERHNVIYYTFGDQGFWCGTSKEIVTSHIIKAIKSKVDLWNSRMNRLINNL